MSIQVFQIRFFWGGKGHLLRRYKSGLRRLTKLNASDLTVKLEGQLGGISLRLIKASRSPALPKILCMRFPSTQRDKQGPLTDESSLGFFYFLFFYCPAFISLKMKIKNARAVLLEKTSIHQIQPCLARRPLKTLRS